MELKFSKEQICTILKKYYKEQMDIEGDIKIRDYITQVGSEMHPTQTTMVEMTIEGNMEIADMKVPVNQQIPKSELENAVCYFLSQKNIELESLEFDKGITKTTVGFGMHEEFVDAPYFKGVVVKTKNKTKKLGGI